MLISLLRKLLSLLLALTTLFFLYKYGLGDVNSHNLTAEEDYKVKSLKIEGKYLYGYYENTYEESIMKPERGHSI